MRQRFDAGTVLVAAGAVLLLVSLFLDWFGAPGSGSGVSAWTTFEVLDLLLAALALAAISTLFVVGDALAVLQRALPWISLTALVIVASQLIDPPPAALDAERETGAWLALAATLVMSCGSLLSSARISVVVDVQGRERRRRMAAVDAREEPTTPAAPPPPPPRDPGLTQPMRQSETGSALEVVAFRAVPATADVAVLHLEGRFAGVRPRRFDRLRLHVTHGGGRADELVPVHAAPSDEDGTIPFRASWAVPVQDVETATFALAVGRDLLLELPAPHVEAPDGEPGSSHVRLAREINELRRQADEATTAWSGASRALEAEVARVQAEHAAELERVRSEHAAQLDTLRAEADAASGEHTAAIEALRSEHAAALDALRSEHLRATEQAQAEHDAALAAAAREAEEARRAAIEAEPATDVLPGTPPRTARMRVAPPPAEVPPRRDIDLNDISGARAIALALLALFFLLLLVILGIGPL